MSAASGPPDAGHVPFASGAAWRSQAGIPVRNLWTLLVYAAGLARFLDPCDVQLDGPGELPELLARLLAFVVERRLRRNPSRGYQPRQEVRNRLRGRADWLRTEAALLLVRGKVACRFEELSFDTPRNRLVRAALEKVAAAVREIPLSTRCRSLARNLDRQGVGAERPSRGELARDQIARHDADDHVMVTVAQLALDLVLPSEDAGGARLSRLERDERLLRRIFEQAVAGLYRHELDGREWWIQSQKPLKWDCAEPTANAASLLPSMVADIVIERAGCGRTILDTKFTGILAKGQYGQERFKSGHLYQLYSYLQSQAGQGDPVADRAEGLLLYPALDRDVDEAVTIQRHRIRFATVDLSREPAHFRTRLLGLVGLGDGSAQASETAANHVARYS